ncbi:MAG: hypothetical protein MI757_00605 [Pirellulales bacterium]|nr:hypothetical protein [Pirellulales bacterium]
MSHDSADVSDKLAPIEATVDSFRGARTDLDHFVGELLDTIENQQREIAAQQAGFDKQRTDFEERIQTLEQSIQQYEESKDAAADRDTKLAKLRDIVLQHQRDATTQAEAMQALEAENDQLRHNYEAANAEVAQLQDQLSAASSSEPSQPDPQAESLQAQNDQLQTELEAVRDRAVELNEKLREAQRKSAEERDEWTAELRQMRKILEQQRVAPAPVPAGTPMVAMPAAAAATPADAVLTNVMAQFELVQQDVQRHRSAG